MQIREALTFDDVLLVPAASSVLPSTADTRTRVTRVEDEARIDELARMAGGETVTEVTREHARSLLQR